MPHVHEAIEVIAMLGRAQLEWCQLGVDTDTVIEEGRAMLREGGAGPAFSHLVPIIAVPWGACGFPVVELTRALAESILAAPAPPASDIDAATPAGAFAVKIPAGVVTPDGGVLVVNNCGPSIACVAVFPDSCSLLRAASLSDFAAYEIDWSECASIPANRAKHERRAALSGRLVVGTRLAIARGEPGIRWSRALGGAPRRSNAAGAGGG